MKILLILTVLLSIISCADEPNSSYKGKSNLKTVSLIDEEGKEKVFFVYRIGDCQYIGRNLDFRANTLLHKGDCNNPIHSK